MATKIQLHHIGEVLVASLLGELNSRGQFNVECVRHSNCSLRVVLEQSSITGPFSFHPEIQLQPIELNHKQVLFDGAHCVDVLCQGSTAVGLALEAKLGLDRMGATEFEKRFLRQVSLTKHARRRIKGSMVAILNYRVFQCGQALPLCTAQPAVEIISDWFLVIRRAVWEQWNRRNREQPPLSSHCHATIVS